MSEGRRRDGAVVHGEYSIFRIFSGNFCRVYVYSILITMQRLLLAECERNRNGRKMISNDGENKMWER